MDSSSSSMSRAAAVSIEREHMFDKVVTPSDVGKLNRLVIPKQHAEKYLPLINSPSSTEKGLLLNFEDREGKLWRFRYSYWSSSQSYVITKGWSRFVKEKQLDAGDVVSFERGVGGVEIHRLFINSRHRPYARPDLMSCMAAMQHHQLQFQQSIRWNSPCYFGSPISSMPQLQPLNFNKYPYYDQHRICNNDGFRMVNYGPNSVQRLTPMDRHHHMGRIQHGVDDSSMVIDSVPVVQGSSQAKRIRLFGVNMDCPISSETRCNILNSEPILYDDNKGNSVLSYHSLLPSSSHHGEARPPQCSQGKFSGK